MAKIHKDRLLFGEYSRDEMNRLAQLVLNYPGTIIHNAHIAGDADIHVTKEMTILTKNIILSGDDSPPEEGPPRTPRVRNLGLTLAAAGAILIGLYVRRKTKEGSL